MKTLNSLVKRNLLMFFRNKSAVFFSFLSVIIILGLYVIFLSDLQVLNIKQIVGDVKGIAPLVNSWVMAGLIAVSTVTLSLGALERIVADRNSRTIDDFLVAPIKRSTVFLSYLISTFLITLIITIILFIIIEFYIVFSGGQLLSIIQIIKVLGIIVLCIFVSSLQMLFIVSFLKDEQTYSVITTIVGTLIGFVTGAYIPIGILPKGIQTISNLLPVSQSASLLRKIFLEYPSDVVFHNAAALDSYNRMQGVTLYIGKNELTINFMIIYLFINIILFSILNIIRFKKMKNN